MGWFEEGMFGFSLGMWLLLRIEGVVLACRRDGSSLVSWSIWEMWEG